MNLVVLGNKAAKALKSVVERSCDTVSVHCYSSIVAFCTDMHVRRLHVDRVFICSDVIDEKSDVSCESQLQDLVTFLNKFCEAAPVVTFAPTNESNEIMKKLFSSPVMHAHVSLQERSISVKDITDIVTLSAVEVRKRYEAAAGVEGKKLTVASEVAMKSAPPVSKGKAIGGKTKRGKKQGLFGLLKGFRRGEEKAAAGVEESAVTAATEGACVQGDSESKELKSNTLEVTDINETSDSQEAKFGIQGDIYTPDDKVDEHLEDDKDTEFSGTNSDSCDGDLPDSDSQVEPESAELQPDSFECDEDFDDPDYDIVSDSDMFKALGKAGSAVSDVEDVSTESAGDSHCDSLHDNNQSHIGGNVADTEIAKDESPVNSDIDTSRFCDIDVPLGLNKPEKPYHREPCSVSFNFEKNDAVTVGSDKAIDDAPVIDSDVDIENSPVVAKGVNKLHELTEDIKKLKPVPQGVLESADENSTAHGKLVIADEPASHPVSLLSDESDYVDSTCKKIVIEKPVEKIVEKVVEKPVEKIVEKIVEKPIAGVNRLTSILKGASSGVILVTGDRRAGKTTVALTIARMFARHVQTLCIDMDIKRRGMLSYLNIDDFSDSTDIVKNGVGLIKSASMLDSMVYRCRDKQFDCLLSYYGESFDKRQYESLQNVILTQDRYKMIVIDIPLEDIINIQDIVPTSVPILCIEDSDTGVLNSFTLLDVIGTVRSRAVLASNLCYLETHDNKRVNLFDVIDKIHDIFEFDSDWANTQRVIGSVLDMKSALKNAYTYRECRKW